MITIGELVKKFIQSHPLIEHAIEEDLLNYSSLARKIKPSIESELMKRIEVSAVGMALRRAAQQIQKKLQTYPDIHSEEIIVRSGITEYTIAQSDTISSVIATFLQSISKENKHFLAVTQGVFEVAVIMSKQYEERAKELFKREKITSIQSGISALTLRLPTNNVFIPGVYHRFLQKLAWENINIIDVVSTQTEITILLSDDKVDRAFTLLKE
jgi:aspartokinase